MPSYHDIQFKQPFDYTTGDIELDGSGNAKPMQMIVWVKTPLADPEPAAPDFGASMTLADTVELGADDEPDHARGTRTTLFYYGYNPDWTMNYDRVADVSLPYTYPTNVYNFEYKDARDDAQGFTTVIYFTT